jgi:hypothetical protein
MFVASNASFLIASKVIDAGKLWFFYADASDVAHDEMVVSYLKRRVVLR